MIIKGFLSSTLLYYPKGNNFCFWTNIPVDIPFLLADRVLFWYFHVLLFGKLRHFSACQRSAGFPAFSGLMGLAVLRGNLDGGMGKPEGAGTTLDREVRRGIDKNSINYYQVTRSNTDGLSRAPSKVRSESNR